MGAKYRYGHRPGRRRRVRVLIVLVVAFALLGIGAGLVAWDTRRSQSKEVSGEARTVLQILDESSDKFNVDEPTFSMELPADWKEQKRVNNSFEKSITWVATKKNEDNRWLTLHIDVIPKDRPISRLLPVTAQENGLVYGDLSENCIAFTKGGSFNAAEAAKQQPAPAKWQQIDFICNLPAIIENEVGTGSTGKVNSVKVTGPSKGSHEYFFIFKDHNIQPNYTILYDALNSFKAK